MAQALPVRAVPEQRLITSVRDDVVNISRRLDATITSAVSAQRVLAQVARPGLLPPVSIAAFGAVATLLWRLVLCSAWGGWLVGARPQRHGEPSR